MSRIYLNDDWQFRYDLNTSEYSSVRIPHAVKETPFNYFSEEEYQTVSEYKKSIFAPLEWSYNTVLLTFDGVAHYAEVFLNGEKVGEHYSGYTAFTIDISDYLNYAEDNELVVRVDSRESLNIPPFGNVIDYMTYGGIYRDVYIEVKNTTYISDVFVKASMNGNLCCDVKIEGEISEGMTVRQCILADDDNLFAAEAVARAELSLSSSVEGIKPWSVDEPNLYTLRTELWQGNGIFDVHTVQFGFRDAEFRKDGFYLNGKKLKIRGLNRHQSYPYVGYAMPKSMQEMDADVLKFELGLNTVRTSHYPQSHYFLDRCDEIGLLVITEIPGWQYIGDEVWQDQAVKNVEEMILQYRNHPSIILWGVRINESQDNDALYTRTNALAHQLDPTRPTCGVRNFRKSSLLEDVYTYNEFIHDGNRPGCEPKANITSDVNKPYMITEYNGHMFPTKSFDCEDHRVEHAIRHATVLNAVASHSDISGSCGWCMADYNTHKDFGSGDRICYHGVTDMFRNHKLAAAVYASQGDAPVLEISSSMDIGEHPACIKGDIWAFTNADSLRVYKNDRLIKEYSSTYNNKFRYMPHSPILIDDFIGDTLEKGERLKPRQVKLLKQVLNYIARHGYGKLPLNILWKAAQCMLFYGMKYNDIVDLYTRYAGDWGGASTVYRFDAVKDGKVVKSVTKAPMTKGSLKADAYKTTLIESESYDVTAIRIRAVDENGNALYFSSEPVSIRVEGPVEIIGPHITSLKGGMSGTYVKTMGDRGKATVILSSPDLGEVKVDLDVK
ncbi:MAG: glycoside hydrolase family 2 protein [Clostridia bacterium]|nr:glycoside hydrolase family 2 protein [Clostridia bacterium]